MPKKHCACVGKRSPKPPPPAIHLHPAHAPCLTPSKAHVKPPTPRLGAGRTRACQTKALPLGAKTKTATATPTTTTHSRKHRRSMLI